MFKNQNFSKGLVLLFFKTESCAPCIDLLEKVKMVAQSYKKLTLFVVNADENKQLSADFNVYSAPVILLLADGKETLRKGIYTSINELEDAIDRIYKLMYF